jgi:hypothetical protein
MKPNQSASSLNDAFRNGQMDLKTGPKKHQNHISTNDKYEVHLKDDKGKPYTVKYFF